MPAGFPGARGAITIAGRGSTGRTVGKNATERAAMDFAKANPLGSNARVIMDELKAPRWSSAEGWVKMEQTRDGVTIHYLWNYITGEFDDFKFK
jgi:hypothetical protein